MGKVLKLKGNELMIFALIYSFTKYYYEFRLLDIRFITDWLNISERTARDALRSLLKKDLIGEIRPGVYETFPPEIFGIDPGPD